MAAVRAWVARVRELFQKNPRIQYALVGVLLIVAAYLLVSRLFGAGVRAPVTRTPPAAPSGPAATPAPRAPAPTPAPQGGPPAPVPSTSKSPKEAVVPSGPTGRPDPFLPLFATPGPGQAVPPPPFPGQLPPPPLPGQGSPGFPGGGVAITGIIGDSRSVAIINVGGRTEILTVGEQIGDMRVIRIDSARRVVTFLQAGRRFDVAMGGE
jgi:hypothetical protein